MVYSDYYHVICIGDTCFRMSAHQEPTKEQNYYDHCKYEGDKVAKQVATENSDMNMMIARVISLLARSRWWREEYVVKHIKTIDCKLE